MKNVKKQLALIAAMSLLLSQGSGASDEVQRETAWDTAQASLISHAFESESLAGIQILDEQSMDGTQGELWPWIIGVVTLDLSLASFFWGDYVPTVASSGGLCVNCDVGTKER